MTQPNTDIHLTPDTGALENVPPHPDDPQRTKSGSAQSPGGRDAPEENSSDMTHGQDGYPGPRPGGESAKTDEVSSSPAAGNP
jgi:hypothetical protein